MRLLLLAAALIVSGLAATAQDFQIDNASGAAVRAEINTNLQALAKNNSLSTAPPTTVQNMWWIDTGPATPLWKMRNTANTAWLTFGEIGASAVTWTGGVETADVTLNGGTIDSTTIGGTTPASGTFTTLDISLPTSGDPALDFIRGADANTHEITRINRQNNAFVFQTRDSTNSIVANDYVMTVGSSGVTEHSLRIENTEVLEVTSAGIDVVGVSQSDGFSTSSTSTLGHVNPASGNTYDLATSTLAPWRNIRLQNAPIVVSDARTKTDIGGVEAAECRAAQSIEIKRFRKVDGDGRWHFGPIAQEVIAAFEAEGLDAEDYALIDGDPDRWAVNYDELQWLKAACQ